MQKVIEAEPRRRAALADPMAKGEKAAEDTFALTERAVLEARVLNHSSSDFFAATTGHIDAQFDLINGLFQTLSVELHGRKAANQSGLILLAAFFLSLAVVGGWLL